MAKLWLIEYQVKAIGFSSFPIDMLRYDSSFPAYESESSKINTNASITTGYEGFPIILQHYSHANKNWHPNYLRWKSFGWEASNCRCIREL